MAVVRPGVDRLARVLQAAELLGATRAGPVAVVQLPHVPGQRWLALPFDRASARRPRGSP